ncbi:probable inactive protein kinase DDB_G0270444 [Hippoglossus stenolepis]|uniref:probable inactive protein kinase DDB_G0270444 n=1 Tax=Hippoglossus stenolepis TaxID=195615 RepID=UPI001FAF3FE8|nr:probable inactive protein kinase DDB_G0270444 [Hippoglossus stenolepis]
MKTFVLFSLSVAVTLAMPPFAPGVAQNPDLPTEEQPPLVADWEPVQGHVEVEVPAPQARLGSKKSSAAPEDMEQIQKESPEEVEVKVEPHDKVEQEVKEQDSKVEQEVKAEQEVKVEQKVKEEQEVKVEQEVKEEQDVKVEQEVKEEQDVKVGRRSRRLKRNKM